MVGFSSSYPSSSCWVSSSQESDEAKRQKLEAEVFDIHAENLWYVSSLKQPGDLPQVFYVPVSSRLVNVSDPVAGEWYYAVPESWSIDE